MYPLVSVIIPTYSRPTYLRRCLESVLNQTYTRFFCAFLRIDKRGHCVYNEAISKTNLASSANKSTDLKINKEVIFWKQSKKFQSVFW